MSKDNCIKLVRFLCTYKHGISRVRPIKTKAWKEYTVDYSWYIGLEGSNGTMDWAYYSPQPAQPPYGRHVYRWTNRAMWIDNFNWLDRRIYLPSEFAIIHATREIKLEIKQSLQNLKEYVKYNIARTWICSTFYYLGPGFYDSNPTSEPSREELDPLINEIIID